MVKRIEVINDGEKTDMVMRISLDHLHFILRLKHALKRVRPPRIKPLVFSDLLTLSSSVFNETAEKRLLPNSLYYYRLSHSLYKRGEHRDAYLYLHLSSELLLKFILVKLKYTYYQKYLDPLPAGQDSHGKDNNKSHDVSAIVTYLLKLVPDLSTNTQIRNILSPLATSKSHGRWSEIRYLIDPSDLAIQSQFKVYYETFRSAYAPFVLDINKKGILI